jgi:hypothetical protein
MSVESDVEIRPGDVERYHDAGVELADEARRMVEPAKTPHRRGDPPPLVGPHRRRSRARARKRRCA